VATGHIGRVAADATTAAWSLVSKTDTTGSSSLGPGAHLGSRSVQVAIAVDEDGESVRDPIDQRSGSPSFIRTYGYVTNGLCHFASPIARFVGSPSIRRRSEGVACQAL